MFWVLLASASASSRFAVPEQSRPVPAEAVEWSVRPTLLNPTSGVTGSRWTVAELHDRGRFPRQECESTFRGAYLEYRRCRDAWSVPPPVMAASPPWWAFWR
jgi:hypothetical protein